MRRPLVRSVGLLGRLFAVLFFTVVVEFAASTLLFEQSSRYLVREDEAHRLAEHLAVAERMVGEAPLGDRARLAGRLTTERYRISWTPAPVRAPAGTALGDLREKVVRWEPLLANRALTVALGPRGRSVIGSLALPGGGWLRFRTAAPVDLWQLVWRRVATALLPAALLAAVGALLLRRLLRPIGALTRAADRLGTGGEASAAVVPEAGPGEVRRLIRAFNGMHARIRQLIEDRTQALAAVGHDLRTPLARLRLRADAVADPAVRRAIEADVGEMGAMLGSLLSYLAGDADPEKPVRIDVAVLAATLVDDAQDRGREAEYDGPDHVETLVRPLGLKRALGNLIENALHYGTRARVSVAEAGDALLIAVEDDGPGIPDDRLEAVFQPFERLDPARGRNTAGLGLGLAIVRRAAEAEGGTVRLVNRAAGGLRAELRLPRR